MNRSLEIIHAILDNIDTYGIHVQAVGPSADAPNGFVYTVGMTKHGLPELICFGLPIQVIHPYMNRVFTELKNGQRNRALNRDDESFNFAAYFDKVEPEKLRDHATMVFRLFSDWGNNPTFRQIIFPDRNGFYPYEPQCSAEFKKVQPYFGTRRRRDPDHESSFGLN